MRSVNRARASLHCFSYISHSFLHTQKHMIRMQTRADQLCPETQSQSESHRNVLQTSGFVFFCLPHSELQLQQGSQTSGLTSLCKKSLNKCTSLPALSIR